MTDSEGFISQYRRFRGCISKNSYPDRKRAKLAKEAAEKRFKSKMKIYKCPYCKGYHLARKKG